jgi:hypothetical protein
MMISGAAAGAVPVLCCVRFPVALWTLEVLMNRLRWYSLAAAILVFAGALAAARAQKPDTRAALMRQKLELTGRLLEGLTREDFPQIVKSAQALRAISEAADFAQPRRLGKRSYTFLSLEFQEMTDEIASSASEKNLDRATLGYLQLVTNCVRCHRNARDEKK